MYAEIKIASDTELSMSIGYMSKLGLFQPNGPYYRQILTVTDKQLEGFIQYIHYFSIEHVIIHIEPYHDHLHFSSIIESFKHDVRVPVIVADWTYLEGCYYQG